MSTTVWIVLLSIAAWLAVVVAILAIKKVGELRWKLHLKNRDCHRSRLEAAAFREMLEDRYEGKRMPEVYGRNDVPIPPRMVEAREIKAGDLLLIGFMPTDRHIGKSVLHITEAVDDGRGIMLKNHGGKAYYFDHHQLVLSWRSTDVYT